MAWGLSLEALGFLPADRWEVNAAGDAGLRGDAITLSWSLVPDGTEIEGGQASRFISLLDEQFDSTEAAGDLKERPWFTFLDASFQRWSELGGVRFVYEPHDDGSEFRAFPGSPGVRGDVRLTGAALDGPDGTLATSHFPDTGDILLDADEIGRFFNPEQDYLRLRNTLMHEIGHALGLDHVTSSDSQLLMEPELRVSFDGPQLDDIRGLHHLYGDRFEQSHDGRGNDTLATATELGLALTGATISLGESASGGAAVLPGETDFLSISHSGDVDYYAFTTNEAARLSVELIPRGGQFRQGTPDGQELLTNANASSDLSLTLLGADGVALTAVDEQPRGKVETLADFSISGAGKYVIRVKGSSEIIQLYELRIDLLSVAVPEPSALSMAIAMFFAIAVLPRSARHDFC